MFSEVPFACWMTDSSCSRTSPLARWLTQLGWKYPNGVMTKSAGTAAGRFAPAGAWPAASPATSIVKAMDLRSREYSEVRDMVLPSVKLRFFFWQTVLRFAFTDKRDM